MVLTDREYGKVDIFLGDDGTLDTIIEIMPHDSSLPRRDFRFSQDYAANFRNQDGELVEFEELAAEAWDAYCWELVA
jgi:hypothetical protein